VLKLWREKDDLLLLKKKTDEQLEENKRMLNNFKGIADVMCYLLRLDQIQSLKEENSQLKSVSQCQYELLAEKDMLTESHQIKMKNIVSILRKENSQLRSEVVSLKDGMVSFVSHHVQSSLQHWCQNSLLDKQVLMALHFLTLRETC
jgi:hypothetical protein